MDEIKIGSRVYTTVSVCGKTQRISLGVVVSDDGGGTCGVDIMSLHGGAPWVGLHEKSNLILEDDAA